MRDIPEDQILQATEISLNSQGVARPLNAWWKTYIRFPKGTDDRIKAALHADEPDATTFIRLAVEAELARREREGGKCG